MKFGKIILIASLMPTVVFAGFGNLKVPGIGESKPAAAASSSADASGLQDSLVRDYVLASSNINQAQEKLLAAFGKKDLAAKVQTLRQSFADSGETPSKQDLKRMAELTDEANEAISVSVEQEQELTEEGKQAFKDSIPYMVKGAVGIAKLGKTAGDFSDSAKNEIKAAGMMGAAKVKSKLDAGLYVAPKVPGLIGSTAKTTKMLVAYGKKTKVLDADEQYDDALEDSDGPA
jgi:hypothetical protein